MALTATNSSNEPRAVSLGPIKMQVINFTVASGDTSGTITANQLTRITDISIAAGIKMSAAPTFSGNVATLAFADPVATVAGCAIVFGV